MKKMKWIEPKVMDLSVKMTETFKNKSGRDFFGKS